MKKFTKIVESLNSQKYYQITAEVELLIKAENEGEAGYLADSILGGIKEQSDFSVSLISEISEDEYKKSFESVNYESSDWQETDNKLVKNFTFDDFNEALDFINKVGEISESLNHHPEIINTYNKVTLKLQTHNQNQITDLDYELAKKIDNLFNI